MLTIGDKAPLNVQVFTAEDQETTLGDIIKESGAEVLVVYFYPKDNTPGCTKQACSFRDLNAEIEANGAKVIGISKDPISSHTKFKEKHNLNFMLLSDPETKLQQAFGVWVEKSMYGKKYLGTQRSTFILNKNGEVLQAWEKANPTKNPQEVLDYLKAN